MESARKLRRVVWALMGVSVLCVTCAIIAQEGVKGNPWAESLIGGLGFGGLAGIACALVIGIGSVVAARVPQGSLNEREETRQDDRTSSAPGQFHQRSRSKREVAPLVRILGRGVWLLLGMSALCIMFIRVVDTKEKFSPVALATGFAWYAAIGCAMAAGGLAVTAWLASFSWPHEQEREERPPNSPEDVP
jgi:hypothetical protein